MEATISTSIFTELDRCTSSEEFSEFIMPTNLDEPISITLYSSEDEIHDIDD